MGTLCLKLHYIFAHRDALLSSFKRVTARATLEVVTPTCCAISALDNG